MATIQLKRSDVTNKRPLASALVAGELALNYSPDSPGLFFAASDGSLIKLGPAAVSATAPNSTPASGGATGNCLGELWFDTSLSSPILKIFTGSTFDPVVPTPLIGITTTTSTGLGVNAAQIGANNTCIGYNAGAAITTATTFTAVGAQAGQTVTANAARGIAFGFGAGRTATDFTDGIMIGGEAGGQATTANTCIAIGANALNKCSSPNQIAIGVNALANCVTSSNADNVVIGNGSLGTATAVDQTVVVGNNAVSLAQEVSGSVIVGAEAGRYTRKIDRCVFVGAQTGPNLQATTTLWGCTFLGGYAGSNGESGSATGCTGNFNTLIGYQCGIYLGNGVGNTVIGNTTCQGLTGSTSNNVILADGSGNIRFRANSAGAWSPDGTNFGSAGQVLKSNGPTAAPSWSNLAVGTSTTFQSYDGKTVTIENGLITSIA